MTEMDSEAVLRSFFNNVEGMPMQYNIETNEPVKCDSCTTIIHPNRTLSAWFTVRDADGTVYDTPVLYRVMCEDCTPPARVWKDQGYSPKGWFEIVTTNRLGEDMRLRDTKLRYYSPTEEGGDWKPAEILNAMLPVSGEAIVHKDMDGPYDIIDVLVWGNIDPRDVMGSDGVEPLPQHEKQQNLERMQSEAKRKIDPAHVEQYWERVEEHGKRMTVESDDSTAPMDDN